MEELFAGFFDSQEPAVDHWRHVIARGPGKSLLGFDVLNRAMHKSGRFYLVSAVKRRSDYSEVFAGMGCLGNVIYCVEAYPTGRSSYDIHNFGTVVMRHRADSDFDPILFELDAKKLQLGRINYLRMGDMLYCISQDSAVFDEPRISKEFQAYCKNLSGVCFRYLEDYTAKFRHMAFVESDVAAKKIVDEVAQLTRNFKSLSYLYFEAVSLAIMLYANDKHSEDLRAKGEFNNNLYIELTHRYKKQRMGDAFDSYSFAPSFDELRVLFEGMRHDKLFEYAEDEIYIAIANNIIFYSGTCFNTRQAILGNLFFDFCSTNSSPDLRIRLDEAVATLLASHSSRLKYDVVMNSTIEKGEFGICTDIGQNLKRVVLCEYNDDKTSMREVKEISVNLRPITHFDRLQ
ncbi:MAG: hypothetical protein KIH63_005005 [Candidatus Saccharibacteria bacterium]|nr:hypothetical protein [Candidatus Saccharibacteria bacterium]